MSLQGELLAMLETVAEALDDDGRVEIVHTRVKALAHLR